MPLCVVGGIWPEGREEAAYEKGLPPWLLGELIKVGEELLVERRPVLYEVGSEPLPTR